ncbi:hypothetical protein ACU4GI_24520 [Cupriavidus basilensis]
MSESTCHTGHVDRAETPGLKLVASGLALSVVAMAGWSCGADAWTVGDTLAPAAGSGPWLSAHAAMELALNSVSAVAAQT